LPSQPLVPNLPPPPPSSPLLPQSLFFPSCPSPCFSP
jgi:hypothetical protein